MRTGLCLSLSSSLSSRGWLENSSSRCTMHRLGVSTRRKYGEELLESVGKAKSWPIDAFVKGFEISFLTISFVLKTNDSPNQSLESLKFFWLQIGLAPRRCSLLTPSLFTLPSKMMKTSIFFLSRHGLVSRIFLIPMIKKKRKRTSFFLFQNEIKQISTRPVGENSSRVASARRDSFQLGSFNLNQCRARKINHRPALTDISGRNLWTALPLINTIGSRS